MTGRLAWVPVFAEFLRRATDGAIAEVSVQDHVDPLRKILRVRLRPGWSDKNFNPVQGVAHAFAKANDCAIARAIKRPGEILLDVLIKQRLGPPMARNPYGDLG